VAASPAGPLVAPVAIARLADDVEAGFVEADEVVEVVADDDASPGSADEAGGVAAGANETGAGAPRAEEPRLETKPVVVPTFVGHDQPMLDLPERSGPRPPVAGGLPIGSYSEDELDGLVAWICSDGIARDDAEVAAELRAELAVARRGKKVDAVVAAAVRRRSHQR